MIIIILYPAKDWYMFLLQEHSHRSITEQFFLLNNASTVTKNR